MFGCHIPFIQKYCLHKGMTLEYNKQLARIYLGPIKKVCRDHTIYFKKKI